MMRRRHRPNGRRGHLPSMAALVALAAASLGFADASRADVSAVSGSAFGESVTVSLSGAPPTSSGPLPSVTLPSSGGSVSESAPSIAVRQGGPSAPFDGKLLETGALSAASQGTTGRAGASTSSAAVARVDALAGTLAIREVGSRCTSAETGVTASATLTGGSVQLSRAETVALPDDPAPNTTLAGRSASGDTFTVIVNEQKFAPGSVTANAVRVVLHGPSAVGDIVLAQSRCATAVAPVAPSAKPPPALSAAATAAADRSAPAADSTAASAADHSPDVAARATSAAARLQTGDVGRRVAAQESNANQNQVGGGAFGYHAFNITLFDGAQPATGPAPSVTLPPTGADPPLTASAPSGRARYGPAELFSSGELKVSTQGKTSPTRSATSSASVANVGPGPFTASTLASTCTSAEGSQTASATLTGGRLVTSEGASEDPGDDTVVTLPDNPAVNASYEGKLQVGDSFRVVLNEQQASSDSITVNAMHLYLLGPTAKGDLIVGQSRCSRVGEASSSPSSTSSSDGAPGSRSAAGSALADTGMDVPLWPALGLVTVGLALSLWGRRGPVAPPEHRPAHERL